MINVGKGILINLTPTFGLILVPNSVSVIQMLLRMQTFQKFFATFCIRTV